jgi:alpha-tubulin suppressor-like RCC1 family protein
MEESGTRNRTRENDITGRCKTEVRRKSWLPVMILAIALTLIGRAVSAEITMSFTQPAIAIGFYHSVALKSDGTVTAWGYDYYDQTDVPAGLTGVISVAAGAYHAAALKNDGTVVAWGQNLYGQTTVPADLTGVTAITAGAYHTVALKSDGTLVAWGYNDEGQSAVPAGLTGVIAVSAAGYHTLALKNDGTVVGWGYNANGESTVPANLTDVVSIAAGGYHSVALKRDGTVVIWGRNVEGQGNVPAGLTGVVAIAAGTNHTAVLKSDGTVVAWGDNTYGEISVPPYLTGMIALTAGKEHTMALKSDGTVVQWGRNSYGECTTPAGLNLITRYRVTAKSPAIAAGDSHTVSLKSDGTAAAWGYDYYSQATVPTGLSGVIGVAAGANHTVALKSDGTVVAWGNNNQGQAAVPAGLTSVAYIAAGAYHTVALKSDGTLVAWGDNTYGESTVPAGLSGVTAVAAAAYHTVALRSDGTVVAWGDNTYGESSVPAGLSGVTAVAAGAHHTVALKSDGTVVAWGDNTYGESAVSSDLSGVIDISAGGSHTVALRSDGTVVAWGDNTYGESAVPAGLNGVTAIAAGAHHTVALKSDGTVAGWGSNDQGQTTAPAGLNLGSGRISCIPTSVGYNSSSACTIMPGIGYQVLDVKVGPTAGGMSSVGAYTSYTINNVTADMTIAATYGANTVSDTTPPITTAYPGGGTYSAAQNITLSCNDGNGSGCSATYYCFGLGCTPATFYRGAFTISNSTYLSFVSTDHAGNTETVKTQTFTITAADPTLIATAGPNGSISPSGTLTVPSGGNAAFIITGNVGYRIADVLVDGVSVGPLTLYTFSNVQTGHTISATFTLDIYTVMATADLNGSITPSGTTTVNKGGSATYTIIPDAGYDVRSVLVDGANRGALTSYTFANIADNHAINAYFKVKTFTITASSGTGGSISQPVGVVNMYTSQTCTITPTAGYHILDVLVDGVSVGPVTTYTFTNITDNHTIAATFEVNPSFTITASAGVNGAMSPSGTVSVVGGTNRTFTMTANAGYRVADIQVDGASVGALTSYTFNSVQTTHTISATFTLDVYTVTAAADVNGTITPSGITTLNRGASQTCTITPDAGYDVQNVVVDGASKGAITSYTFANMTANHTINAYFKVKTFTITVNAGAGGSITWPLGTTTLNIGATQTYTITPTAGYHILDVQVDGVSVGAVGTYTFTNVTSNHTIVATFEANPSYTITASAGANGTLSPSGSVSVLGGTNKTFIITPEAGCRVVDVTIDGTSAGPLTTYTFANITQNHSISATFSLILFYNISASAGPNGSISPSGAVSVQQFTNQTYTITPNAGYRIADVQVDGASVGAPTSYTFYSVQTTHTISATFSLDVYTVTAAADVNGSITPSGATTVNRGASQTYAIASNPGYQVLNVLVDGASMGAITSYTFTNITANHTINAYFKVITCTITASAGTGGVISPLGTATLNIGASQTYTITPSAGYRITDVLIDGASAGAVATYAFTNVTGDHTISAIFGTNPSYIITASAGANGTISPGTVTVLGGVNQKFTFTAVAGYRVADVLVDGVSVGALTSYTFYSVQTTHTISATFTLNVYTITSAADVNGSITPSGVTTVNKGASQTFTITPDAGHQVRSVIVDGANRGAISSFTFTNVLANHTVNAYFK